MKFVYLDDKEIQSYQELPYSSYPGNVIFLEKDRSFKIYVGDKWLTVPVTMVDDTHYTIGNGD